MPKDRYWSKTKSCPVQHVPSLFLSFFVHNDFTAPYNGLLAKELQVGSNDKMIEKVGLQTDFLLSSHLNKIFFPAVSVPVTSLTGHRGPRVLLSKTCRPDQIDLSLPKRKD